MVQEDYVNKEIMNLLLEKDYWQDCDAYYIPTQSQVMKWLRETHGIHIVIHPSSGVYYGKYCLSIYVQRVKNKDFHLTYQTHEDTYEKAVEEGIGYSLISLI